MRSFFIRCGVSALVVMFAVVLVSCPGSFDNTINNDVWRNPAGDGVGQSKLSGLTIAGRNAEIGSPAASHSAVTAPGAVTITNLVARSVVVVAEVPAGASYKTAHVSGGGEPQWENALFYSIISGDFICIEITSANGQSKSVYKVEVTVIQKTAVTVTGSVTLGFTPANPPNNIAVEAYSAQEGTNLVSRANANISGGSWSLLVPPNQPVWFKILLTDDTGYTFDKVVSGVDRTFSVDTSGVVLDFGGLPPPQLTAFTLIDASVNDYGVKQNKTGVINQETGLITMPATGTRTISADTILNFRELAAEFTVSSGGKLYVGAVEQQSGISANDYYKQVTFTVRALDGSEKTYTVAGATETSIVGTTTFQTQGFGVFSINSTNKTLGLPEGTNIGKINIIWNPTGTYTYIGPEGRFLQGGTDFRWRGNYSLRNDLLKSINLKLNSAAAFDYYNYKTGKFEVLPAHRRWTLLAHPNDGSRIKTTTGYEMGRRVLDKMGWQPRADFVHTFLNGEYKGLYILTEIIRTDRLGITPEITASNRGGGWIVEMNNYWWYANDLKNRSNEYIFDEMYNFMTSHLNPIQYSVADRSSYDGPPLRIKQQGVVWSWDAPDENLGWYYADPPLGSGNLNYLNTTNFPRRGIVLHAKLKDGAEYNRRSRPVAEWIVPDDHGSPNGMGTPWLAPAGTFGRDDGGVYGTRTLGQVYPNHEQSLFVYMAKYLQDTEDAIYAHDYGVNGVGGYHNYIDIDSFIDFHIAMELAGHWEVIVLNGNYMHYDPRIGKLKMGPLWDFDQAWNGNAQNGAAVGFVRKTPFWYKELTGWEMHTGGNSLNGRDMVDRRDPYYIGRLQKRWAEVKVKFNEELDPYIDAQFTRFGRLSGYSDTLVVRSNALKNTIANRVKQLDAVINSY